MSIGFTRAIRIAASFVALIVVGSIPVTVPGGDDIAVPATKQPVAFPPFTATTVITQQFPATGTAIEDIDLSFGMGRATDRGAVQVNIAAERDGNWQPLNQSRVAMQDITNGRATLLFTPPLTVEVGQLLRLTMQPDTDAAPSVTWLLNPDYHADRFALTVNGAPQMGTARFGVAYGRQRGRLAQLGVPVFQRISVLLNGVWRGVLLVAGALLLVALLALPWFSAPTFAGVPAVDRDADQAILGAIETGDAAAHRSGQEGQG